MFRQSPYILNADGSINLEATRKAISLFAERISEHVTSMSSFGPVAVDHFTGRRVEGVDVNNSPAEGEPVWIIVLEGDALIENFDPTIPAPLAIVGAGLTRTFLERSKTRLQFGLEEVTLNPLEYAIVDVNYTQGERVYAQRSEANMPPSLPPDPSPERVVDGPEGE